MKKIFSLILISLLSLGITSAQTSFKLNPNPRTEPLSFNSNDTLKILAVMVEFQEDNDGNTFGNGKFGSIYSQDYGNDILDPLPHNAAYFENHLEFAKNYYEKVSNGVLNISYKVIPNIVTVSKIMRDYSPAPQTDDFTGLGEFAEEVWGLADQSMQVNFADYDLFAIFHAGVGREIPTPGSIGLERDIPSVFLSNSTLEDIFGSGFTGFPVNNGAFNITNTAILPSTENREIESFGEVFLQEFTINGLIVGTIASYIGLPDLFNTETGTSAIGRFGLMDGQALFAYSGLFPPEPSAWEKIYLGWITPTELSLTDQTVNLTTYETAVAGDQTLIKIPINANEYYLIENRKRDANKDGAIITYKVGNSTNTISFDKDYPAFSPFGADTLIGVITDVDEFDWALPAFEEDQTFDDSFEDVGFIIWHIDEEVIRNNLASNSINNDRDRLGVRVVEADGIFDIGEEFTNIFGEIVIGEGTKQDTWYSSNPSEFYINEFNATTKPAAVSNLGANSLISISNISGIANNMSFDFSVNQSSVSLLFAKEVAENGVQLTAAHEYSAIRNADGGVFINGNSGNDFGYLNNFSTVDLASYTDGGTDYLAGANQDSLKIYVRGITLPFETIIGASLNAAPSAPILINSIQQGIEIFVGLENGSIQSFQYTSSNSLNELQIYNAFTNEPVKQIVYANGLLSAVSGTSYWNSNGDSEILSDIKQFAEVTSIEGALDRVFLRDNKFIISSPHALTSSHVQSSFVINTTNIIKSFSVADIKGDGNNYLVFNNGNYIEARNTSGASADYFPVEIKSADSLLFSPLVLDFNNDGSDDILVFASNGNIFLVNGLNGEVINPFPISSGNAPAVQPVITGASYSNSNLCFIGKSESTLSDLFSVWKLSDQVLDVNWSGSYADFSNNSFIKNAGDSNKGSVYFPKEAAYNWPNPVYGDETYIRFYVGTDSEAEVKIFDLAGDLVAELRGNATGGMDNEITWNVANIQSGVYFAQLSVKGNGGNTDSKLIKIAVIK